MTTTAALEGIASLAEKRNQLIRFYAILGMPRNRLKRCLEWWTDVEKRSAIQTQS